MPEIGNRLGWLTISEQMLEHALRAARFARAAARTTGFTDAVLLGMGGSSLGPEVIRRSFGEIPDGLRLHVLDSTDPGAVLAVERAVDLEQDAVRRLVEVGRHDRDALAVRATSSSAASGDGSHFVAITDPGSPLEELAEEHGFRRVFENDPDIGGRYSVLSLLRARAGGADGRRHRGDAATARQVAEQNCAQYDDGAANSGLWLGVAIGELALRGPRQGDVRRRRRRSRASASGSSS